MIYVHVPFCRSFCTYCSFYSEAAPRCRKQEDIARQESLFEEYIAALEKEIRTRKDDINRVFASGGVNTLYVGGGTPSVLPLPMFERLVTALREVGHPCDFEEFTVEVNPEDIIEKETDFVRGLVALGVNRVSMGVQSFDDDILKWMNRRHSADQAVKAYRMLEEAGVDNISIDLIFGLPQMDEALWRETLSRALSISASGRPPRHISAYQLSVEEDSMLEKLIAKGRWTEAGDEVCERQYDVLCEVLKEAGYNHYEISNFALPGFEAVHNSAYWSHRAYVGLGPGAHSYLVHGLGETDLLCIRDLPVCSDGPLPTKLGPSPYPGVGECHLRTSGCAASPESGTSNSTDSRTEQPDAPGVEYVRQWNESSLREYLEAAKEGDFSSVQGSERLDEEQLIMEKVMLGLRTAAGVSEVFLREACGGAVVDEALSCSNLVYVDDVTTSGSEALRRIRIPENRFFVSDNIISTII